MGLGGDAVKKPTAPGEGATPPHRPWERVRPATTCMFLPWRKYSFQAGLLRPVRSLEDAGGGNIHLKARGSLLNT